MTLRNQGLLGGLSIVYDPPPNFTRDNFEAVRNSSLYSEGSWSDLISDAEELAHEAGIRLASVTEDVGKKLSDLSRLFPAALAQLYFFSDNEAAALSGRHVFHVDSSPSNPGRRMIRLCRTLYGPGTIISPHSLSAAHEGLTWNERELGWQVNPEWSLWFQGGPGGIIHKAPSPTNRTGYLITVWEET